MFFQTFPIAIYRILIIFGDFCIVLFLVLFLIVLIIVVVLDDTRGSEGC